MPCDVPSPGPPVCPGCRLEWNKQLLYQIKPCIYCYMYIITRSKMGAMKLPMCLRSFEQCVLLQRQGCTEGYLEGASLYTVPLNEVWMAPCAFKDVWELCSSELWNVASSVSCSLEFLAPLWGELFDKWTMALLRAPGEVWYYEDTMYCDLVICFEGHSKPGALSTWYNEITT